MNEKPYLGIGVQEDDYIFINKGTFLKLIKYISSLFNNDITEGVVLLQVTWQFIEKALIKEMDC